MIWLALEFLSQSEETAHGFLGCHEGGFRKDDSARSLWKQRKQQMLFTDIPVAITRTVRHRKSPGTIIILLDTADSNLSQHGPDGIGNEIRHDIILAFQGLRIPRYGCLRKEYGQVDKRSPACSRRCHRARLHNRFGNRRTD